MQFGQLVGACEQRRGCKGASHWRRPRRRTLYGRSHALVVLGASARAGCWSGIAVATILSLAGGSATAHWRRDWARTNFVLAHHARHGSGSMTPGRKSLVPRESCRWFCSTAKLKGSSHKHFALTCCRNMLIWLALSPSKPARRPFFYGAGNFPMRARAPRSLAYFFYARSAS